MTAKALIDYLSKVKNPETTEISFEIFADGNGKRYKLEIDKLADDELEIVFKENKEYLRDNIKFSYEILSELEEVTIDTLNNLRNEYGYE